MTDKLGDRMKLYESHSEINLMPNLPTFARVDGRSFSSFTKGMDRPYDEKMSQTMLATAMELAKETNACMTYTQSDEITLAWYSEDPKSQIWFNGRHSKMVSQIAALATLYFYKNCLELMPNYAKKMPSFDARVWQVPSLTEGSNVFLWREWDATKNSITMAASKYYSHKELHGKNGSEKQEMLFAKGVNWNDYPSFFKKGQYIQRKKFKKPYEIGELESLPEKHQARENPGLLVERSTFQVLELPPLTKVDNKNEVIFFGEEPELKTNP